MTTTNVNTEVKQIFAEVQHTNSQKVTANVDTFDVITAQEETALTHGTLKHFQTFTESIAVHLVKVYARCYMKEDFKKFATAQDFTENFSFQLTKDVPKDEENGMLAYTSIYDVNDREIRYYHRACNNDKSDHVFKSFLSFLKFEEKRKYHQAQRDKNADKLKAKEEERKEKENKMQNLGISLEQIEQLKALGII